MYLFVYIRNYSNVEQKKNKTLTYRGLQKPARLDDNQYRSINQRMIDWFLCNESEAAHNLQNNTVDHDLVV